MLLELADDAPAQFVVAVQVLDAIADSGDVRAAATVEIDVDEGNANHGGLWIPTKSDGGMPDEGRTNHQESAEESEPGRRKSLSTPMSIRCRKPAQT